jgi:hypothetical protein
VNGTHLKQSLLLTHSAAGIFCSSHPFERPGRFFLKPLCGHLGQLQMQVHAPHAGLSKMEKPLDP